MKRTKLATARAKKHWTLEEAAEHLVVDVNTLSRWERGKAAPRAYNIQRLCEVYGTTAVDLGLEDASTTETASLPCVSPKQPGADDINSIVATLLAQDLTLRLLKITWTWPRRNMHFHELQWLIVRETEDYDTMAFPANDPISRRDALRRLALVPIELCGLSALGAALMHPPEEILTQCAAGITACWHLRKGKDLVFVSDVISNYLPTLKEVVRSGSPLRQKAAADLLVQGLLLKSVLAWNLTTTADAISYAQQAEAYSKVADNPLLQICAIRTQAAAYCYANRWEQALQAGEKARYLLETARGTPISQVVKSYVYAGVATYQSYNGQKDDALSSLKKAETTFFSQTPDEVVPIWVDHSIGNLLNNAGLTYFHLGSYKEAINSFTQIRQDFADDKTTSMTCRITTMIEEVTAESSRNDQPRDMERCIDLWKRGMEGAKVLQSTQRFNEALVAHASMCAAWPGERRIKELRDLIVHW